MILSLPLIYIIVCIVTVDSQILHFSGKCDSLIWLIKCVTDWKLRTLFDMLNNSLQNVITFLNIWQWMK
jgi:hypothetical protein